MKKAQTATEWTILLGFTFVALLIVVAAVIDIPAIGGSFSQQTSTRYWHGADIAILGVSLEEENKSIMIQNNLRESIQITEFLLNQENVIGGTSINLTTGQTSTINISSFIIEPIQYNIQISYLNKRNNQTYVFIGDIPFTPE